MSTDPRFYKYLVFWVQACLISFHSCHSTVRARTTERALLNNWKFELQFIAVMFDQIACVRCAHIADPTSSCAQTRTRCVAQLLARRTVSQKCAYASRIGGQLYFVPRNVKKNVVFKVSSRSFVCRKMTVGDRQPVKPSSSALFYGRTMIPLSYFSVPTLFWSVSLSLLIYLFITCT